MARNIVFEAVGPIGETDIHALAVKEVGPAVGHDTQCLGFTHVSRDRTAAVRRRDQVQIGPAVNGRDPKLASCWFSVGGVDALRREHEAKVLGPGIVDEQRYDGMPCRVFFAKEPYGVWSCFTQPL
jgi:hypothetical protein